MLRTYRTLASSVADHGGVVGESREFFVREILSRFLPKSVEVGTGQIIDSNHDLSNQIDIVISRPDFPVLTSMAMSDIFFAESVIATIEVKSTLKKGTLWEALDNSRSVKRRDVDYRGKGDEEFLSYELREHLPSTYVFGYTGYKRNLSHLKKAIYTWIEDREATLLELPNVIVTEGCVVITNYGGVGEVFDANSMRQSLGHDCIFVARKDPEALTWLLSHLLGYIGGIHSGGRYDHVWYAWGVRFANATFREQDWLTWGKWEHDKVTKKVHMDLDEGFDAVYPGD